MSTTSCTYWLSSFNVINILREIKWLSHAWLNALWLIENGFKDNYRISNTISGQSALKCVFISTSSVSFSPCFMSKVYVCFSYLLVISTCKISLFTFILEAVAGVATAIVLYPRNPLSRIKVVETCGNGDVMLLY